MPRGSAKDRNKTTAIEALRAHVEEWWQFYAKLDHTAFIMLIDGQWSWSPLYNDLNQLDDLYTYIDTLRQLTQRFKPTAVAFAAREVDNEANPRFVTAIEFKDDPRTQSIIWDIVDNRLINARSIIHEQSDAELDDSSVFYFKMPKRRR